MGASTPDLAPRPTGIDRDPAHDFDFYFGSWRIHHHQLVERLAGSDTWREFESTSVAQPTSVMTAIADRSTATRLVMSPDTSSDRAKPRP